MEGRLPVGPPPSELLYDAVALAMLAYSRAAFVVRTLGSEHVRFRPGLMVLATHRWDTDVPVLASSIYVHGRLYDRRLPRLHFAARDDLFERGFFAGFPPALPVALRRALFGIGVEPLLRRVRVHPLARAATMKLGQALALVAPETPLDGLLPDPLAARLRAEAVTAGISPPRTAVEALRGELGPVLWEPVTSDELDAPEFEEAWRRRAAQAAANLREVVAVVRAGEPLLLFPEGRPSPDGSVGPVERGVSMLVRRGRPQALLPVGVAYDPLTRGRPRAYVSFGPELAPPAEAIEAEVLAALRTAMPLTCGQAVAGLLVATVRAGRDEIDAGEVDAALAEKVDVARAAGRHVEPSLVAADARRARLSDCLAAVVRLGGAEPRDRRRLSLAPTGVLADDGPLARLAREHESVTEHAQPPPAEEPRPEGRTSGR